jgi:hypothetical protein
MQCYAHNVYYVKLNNDTLLALSGSELNAQHSKYPLSQIYNTPPSINFSKKVSVLAGLLLLYRINALGYATHGTNGVRFSNIKLVYLVRSVGCFECDFLKYL